MNLTRADLFASRRVAIDAAEAAGRLVRSRFSAALAVTAKGTTGDVVTSLDLAAERLVVERLHHRYPSHGVVSEESAVAYESIGPWKWLVDPLDGSNNIVVGLPIAAIGLALCYDNQSLVGVVHEPFVARTWSAVQGRGAWQTDDQALVRQSNTDRRPIVAWTQGYGVSHGDHAAAALRAAVGDYARRVLELWAPLCAWVMLARGDIDGIVGYRIGELDLHAGALIARMAGVEIRAFDGAPFDFRFGGLAEDRSLVAALPEHIGELLELVSRDR